MKLVVISPCTDITLTDKIHRPYKFHTFKVSAVELWHHCLDLSALKHSHENSLDNIIVVVAESDLIASKLFCLAVQKASAHSSTDIARALFYIVDGVKYVTLENRDWYAKRFGVTLDKLPVLFVVSGIHDKESHIELHLSVRLDLLKELRHQHRIFAARDTYRNMVSFIY